ncbi:hypothetical protein K6Y31_09540 [Motilimonas cestriensis]|uniref:Uncharacterized protein n=1 Tax=Motilimonas cestriensis TaxID=2742685 RepID=A0ABS8W7T3_9GAMM|nr:hypothetical protein [Motilimonas cestriensis]MCE2595059.1 hypothetical protein [Motilimonas cestriensis]
MRHPIILASMLTITAPVYAMNETESELPQVVEISPEENEITASYRPLSQSAKLKNVMAALDMMESEIILINVDNDIIIQQRLDALSGWPGGRPQHVLISPNAKWLYVTTDASTTHAANIVVIKVNNYAWKQGFVELEVTKVLQAEPANTSSSYNTPTQTSPLQPIASWTQPAMTQIHGPTILPYSKYVYFTQWSDNKVRVIDTKTQEFASVDPIVIDNVTEQTHGVYFNKSGTLGLSTGYYYDDGDIDLFDVDKKTGALTLQKKIRLGDEQAYAAFTHFNTWIDERYAVTASMQFGPTSNTPAGATIIPPSIWMIDAWEGTAWPILGTANNEAEAGVLRSASDVTVAAGKLYIAEEDSLDGSYGDDGFISIYDLSDKNNPQLIKRLAPGLGLPADFAVAHGLGVSADQRFIYVSSYASKYILKLDTKTDTIVKVYGAADGLTMPHGGYVSGAIR